MRFPVPSNAPWTDVGLDVVAGTHLGIHANGTVRYGPMAPQTTDANGGNFDGTKLFPTSVYPSVIVCSLIGKIGGTTDVGTGTPLGLVGVDFDETPTTSGRLFLGFNDQVGQFGDNSGTFDVTITTAMSCP